MSWTETTTTQIQNRKYGAIPGSGWSRRTGPAPARAPATTPTSPASGRTPGCCSTTQPQATAKLPIATQALAKPRFPTSKA